MVNDRLPWTHTRVDLDVETPVGAWKSGHSGIYQNGNQHLDRNAVGSSGTDSERRRVMDVGMIHIIRVL